MYQEQKKIELLLLRFLCYKIISLTNINLSQYIKQYINLYL